MPARTLPAPRPVGADCHAGGHGCCCAAQALRERATEPDFKETTEKLAAKVLKHVGADDDDSDDEIDPNELARRLRKNITRELAAVAPTQPRKGAPPQQQQQAKGVPAQQPAKGAPPP